MHTHAHVPWRSCVGPLYVLAQSKHFNKYFRRDEILITLRLLVHTIYCLKLFYMLQLMCKKKYS